MTETATFAAGCFWCYEPIFKQLPGVESVRVGYTGGKRANPTYEQISTGSTGHAEAFEITFDPNIITYSDLLDIFWEIHDPTTLNQQGYDVGTQYRSAIFYHSPEQEKTARASKERIAKSGKYADQIVTEINPAVEFYEAEEYHQDYYSKNRNAPYCRVVISPKLEKLRELNKLRT